MQTLRTSDFFKNKKLSPSLTNMGVFKTNDRFLTEEMMWRHLSSHYERFEDYDEELDNIDNE